MAKDYLVASGDEVYNSLSRCKFIMGVPGSFTAHNGGTVEYNAGDRVSFALHLHSPKLSEIAFVKFN